LQPKILVKLEGIWPIFYLKNTHSICCEKKIHTFEKTSPKLNGPSPIQKEICKQRNYPDTNVSVMVCGKWVFYSTLSYMKGATSGTGSVYPSVKTWVL
jgi:hypothetical protein